MGDACCLDSGKYQGCVIVVDKIVISRPIWGIFHHDFRFWIADFRSGNLDSKNFHSELRTGAGSLRGDPLGHLSLNLTLR